MATKVTLAPLLISKEAHECTNLLTFDSKKRDKAREVGFKLFDATEKLKWIKEGKEGFTLDQVIKELTEAQKMLDPIMDKYNYSKLPGRN